MILLKKLKTFVKTDAAHIIYFEHLAGAKLADTQADLTPKQDIFLSLMAVEDINSMKVRDEEFKALCKSQGVKFSRTYNRFKTGGSLRNIFRERQKNYDKEVFNK